MRIRSIRPEFWASEDIAALAWDERLVFIGLWSYVDDNGVGRDNVKLIAADLFPLDDDPRESVGRVSGALSALERGGQIRRYEVNGRPYLFIAAWDTHQRVDKPAKSRYPRPTSGYGDPPESPATSSRQSPETVALGEGEKGRRGEGEKLEHLAPAAPTPPKRGHRLPDTFRLTDDMRAWAAEKHPRLDVEAQTVHFIDYWRAESGAKATKLDWVAAWRTWLRNAERWTNRPANTLSKRDRTKQVLADFAREG